MNRRLLRKRVKCVGKRGKVFYRPSPEERFWKNIDKNGPKMPGMRSRCWTWMGHVSGREPCWYGCLWVDGKERKSHHIAVILDGRRIPKGKQVNHQCGNSLCNRASHLYVGTQKDNGADTVRHGSKLGQPGQIGSDNGAARLNEKQVRRIKRLIREGKSDAVIAGKFGRGLTTIGHIRRGNTWTHVKEDE